MSISAEIVRKLREETGAGMMDCKNALVEAKADLEAARELLRKKGLAAAAKKAGRAATEGIVGTLHPPGGEGRRHRRGQLRDRLRGQDRPSSWPWSRTSPCTSPPPRPLYVTKDEVPADVLDKEKEIYKAQAAAAGQARERPGEDRRGQAQGLLQPVLPARAALRQGPQGHDRPARPGEDRAHQGEHRGPPLRSLPRRRRDSRRPRARARATPPASRYRSRRRRSPPAAAAKAATE